MSFKMTSPSSAGSRPQSSPRPTCRMVRQWHAAAGERDSRHVASCADCQEYYRSIGELDRALRRDAVPRARETEAGSDNLERDILRAVRESAADSAHEPTGWRAGWLTSGIAAAAAAMVAIGVINREGAAERRLSREGAQAIMNTVGTLSDQLVDKAIPSAGELVAKNPMQQEIGSVYSDMRSALDFLALNFLPSASTATPQPARSNG